MQDINIERLQEERKLDEMGEKNWFVVIIGVLMLGLGYLFLIMVGQNYHGPMGFISTATIIGAIIVISYGFLSKNTPIKHKFLNKIKNNK